MHAIFRMLTPGCSLYDTALEEEEEEEEEDVSFLFFFILLLPLPPPSTLLLLASFASTIGDGGETIVVGAPPF